MVETKANELGEYQIIRRAIKYCLFMIVVPIVSFFSSKIILFDGILRLEPVTSSVYSAFVSIVALHVSLVLFILRAYRDSERVQDKPVKKD